MLEVGETVMVRDPAIRAEYHVEPAKIVEVKTCPSLLRMQYLLEFTNGRQEWFNQWDLKKE